MVSKNNTKGHKDLTEVQKMKQFQKKVEIEITT